jgi:hypothetical protein
MGEASADDPISVAAQEIADLNSKINNLSDKVETQELIDIAESKYDAAVAAKLAKDTADMQYDAAVTAEATALQEKDAAQSAVDSQTPIVATALQDKNDAQDDLDIANLNVQTTQSAVQNSGSSGLQYTVYYLTRGFGGVAIPDAVICSGVWNSNSMQPPVCGRYEDFIVKFTGTITVPSHWTSTYFAGYTDDGFKMYINGQLAVDNWREQGSTWSPYSPVYDVSQDKTLDVEIWWYNGGGPGYYHLGWAIPGGWTGAGCDYTGGWGVGFSCNLNTFSYGSGATQAQIDAYNQAVEDQATKQTIYNNKLAYYNTQNQNLTTYSSNLTNATQNLTTAQENLTNSLSAKNTANTNYTQAVNEMNDAIDEAWDSYNEQFKFEEQQRVSAAIAQAAANAAANQPTVDPTPEPSTEPTEEPIKEPTEEPTQEPTEEPTPEQTEPEEANPSPTPDTTDEETVDPTPTPEPETEPSEEPSPQPEDTDPTPEPEPTQDVSENPSKTDNSPIDNATANLIADLTNSNTLAKLTPEQAAVVSQSLGVSVKELAVVAELAKSNPEVATALEEFGDRANANLDAPMPYTLADATTEVQTEAFLADPLGAVFDIDPLELLSNFSELGMDMTDDQREKAQEVIIPVVIVSQIASTLIGMRR